MFQKDEGPQFTAEANAAALAQFDLLDDLLDINEESIKEAFFENE